MWVGVPLLLGGRHDGVCPGGQRDWELPGGGLVKRAVGFGRRLVRFDKTEVGFGCLPATGLALQLEACSSVASPESLRGLPPGGVACHPWCVCVCVG